VEPRRHRRTTWSASRTVEAELKRVPGTREVQTIGGPGRAVQCGWTRRGCASAA
jgi:multidrug efflux pump subunit AcrB